jgi:hypothetical protein
MALAAGESHSLALKSDGTVWAWGYNFEGQLGDGTRRDRLTPTQVSGLNSVVSVTAGYTHSLALKSDGTVWAWGGNLTGELGNGTTTQSLTPVQVKGLGGMVAVAAGYGHCLALKADGTVWSWGRNDVGQLGDGTRTNQSTPIRVSGLGEVVALTSGYAHNLALKNDGTLWAWGLNYDGQLGDGRTMTLALLPVKTVLPAGAVMAPFRKAALPQLAFGGGWQTWLYFYNTTDSVVSFSANFVSQDGEPLNVPLDGGPPVSSRIVLLAPGASTALLAPDRGALVQGWVETGLPSGVGGHAVFRQSVAGRADQEAVVPLAPETSQHAHFVFDEEKTTTGIAFVNPSSQAASVTITVYNPDNAVLGTTRLQLGSKSKMVAVLKNLPDMTGVAGQYGRVAIESASGAISVLGLRFAGEAFTTIPVFHQTESATSRFVLPQLVFGGVWTTEIYLSNTTNQTATAYVRFFSNAGDPLIVPLRSMSPSQTQVVNLAPGATVRLVTVGGPDLFQGWAEANLPGGVIGHAVFRQSVPGRAEQEAVVPLTKPDAKVAEFSFDDIGLTTTMAVLNASDVSTLLTVISTDDDGRVIGNSRISLPARTKQAYVIRHLPEHNGVSGKRGRMRLTVQAGAVAVLGFRFGGEAFTSIPVLHQ